MAADALALLNAAQLQEAQAACSTGAASARHGQLAGWLHQLRALRAAAATVLRAHDDPMKGLGDPCVCAGCKALRAALVQP